jgi:hypothetical protein
VGPAYAKASADKAWGVGCGEQGAGSRAHVSTEASAKVEGARRRE